MNSEPSRWQVAAASVTGAGHLADGAACQDAYRWRVTERGELIIAVCDGMGSSKQGGEAARFVADGLCESEAIDLWLAGPQSEELWRVAAQSLFHAVREGLQAFALSTAPDLTFADFACTAQLAVVAESMLWVAHVGDGRAAARTSAGEWIPLFVPDRGEFVNETVPLSASIPFDAEYWRGHTTCLSARVDAVAMMTDGCENTAFECYVPDDGGRLHDPNRPFPGFFNPVAQTLRSFSDRGISQDELDAKWESFLREGLPRFAVESDDRTMVFGVRVP